MSISTLHYKIISLVTILIFVLKLTDAQDIKSQSFSKLLINSTVKIESVGDSIFNKDLVSFESTGTGFFYKYVIGGLEIPVLVTNYHVIKNTLLSRITFTKIDSNNFNRRVLVDINNFNYENQWIRHPLYDLAILPLMPIFNKPEYSNTKIFLIPFTEEIIPNDSTINTLSAIENVLMVGYPKGLYDSKNNYPIVRRGTTATPLFANFNNKNEFLLDIPIYSGSSGSPVVLLNEGSYSSDGTLYSGSRIFLLGIAVQSVVLKTSERINSVGMDNPLNIAVVIKASALDYFKQFFIDNITKSNFLPMKKKPIKSH